MLHITKRSEFNIQVHLHELHVCLLYASFSPNEPDMVILSQNKASITEKCGETPPRYLFTITFGINKITAPKICET